MSLVLNYKKELKDGVGVIETLGETEQVMLVSEEPRMKIIGTFRHMSYILVLGI